MTSETLMRHLAEDRVIRLRCERGLYTAVLMGPDGVTPSFSSPPAACASDALLPVAEFVTWMRTCGRDEEHMAQLARAWSGLVDPAVTP